MSERATDSEYKGVFLNSQGSMRPTIKIISCRPLYPVSLLHFAETTLQLCFGFETITSQLLSEVCATAPRVFSLRFVAAGAAVAGVAAAANELVELYRNGRRTNSQQR